MADIFISYKRGADEPKVEAIVGGLRANGFTVWWDRDIPAGAPWEETIHAELVGAKLVIVCWSKDAVDSENVRSEARAAKEQDRLLQLLVAPCQPPLFFGEHQGLKVEEVADVYSPRFEAVLAAVRERIGTDAAPKKLRRNDPAVRAWRRIEPRAGWEPLQFGLSYSVLCAAIFVGLLLQRTDSEGLLELSRWVGFTAIAAFLSAWLAYALIVRQPRRTGLFRGTLLALTAATAGASCFLIYDAVVRAITATLEDTAPAVRESFASSTAIVPGGGPQQVGFLTMFAFFNGLLIARLWLPLFVQIVRPVLRSVWPRLGVVALALVAPGLMVWAPFAPGRDTAERRRAEHEFVWAVAERGLETPEEARARAEDPLGRPPPAMVRRIIKLRFPGSLADRPMTYALQEEAAVYLKRSREVPPKTEWVLAADGSGDATTMQELLSRSAGKITIRVRPGLYRAEPDWSDSGKDARAGPIPLEFRNKWRDDRGPPPEHDEAEGPLYAAARAMAYSKTHTLTLVGEPGAIFDETTSVSLPPGMRIEGITLHFGGVRYDRVVGRTHAIRLGYPSALVNVRIEADTGVMVSAASSAQRDAATGEVLRTNLSGVTIASTGTPLKSGLDVEYGAIARIVGVKITGVRTDLPCVHISATQDVTLRNNDFRACSPLPIRAPAPNTNLILDNLGARATPVLDRGEAEDFYRY